MCDAKICFSAAHIEREREREKMEGKEAGHRSLQIRNLWTETCILCEGTQERRNQEKTKAY